MRRHPLGQTAFLRHVWALFSLAGIALLCLFIAGCDDDDPSTPPVAPPIVTTAPQATAVAEGASATFTVVASGDGPLTYQWLRNGTAIAGATGATYTTAATTAADNGTGFSVQVGNAGGSVTSSAATLTVTVSPRGTLQGRVQSSLDGSAIASATVRVGTLQTTTAADGTFSLQTPAADRTAVTVEAAGYAATVRVATVTASQTTALTAQLLPVGTTQSVTVAAGGDVTVPNSTALLRLPAAGLVRRDGGTAAATVTVTLTAINPAVNAALMPGDFTTGTPAAPQPLESFGALVIDIRDASGALYNLAGGSTATLRIPLGTRSAAPPATVPLFFMDTATGLWVQEGTASLQGTGSNRFFEGTVSRIVTWNADQVINTIRVTGCVRDAANQPVAGARLTSDGSDYSGTSWATSGADGSFTIAVRRSSLATLTGLTGTLQTNTVTVAPSATDYTLPSCLITSAATSGLKVTLSWGNLPPDLDSHFVLPSGVHLSYTNLGSLQAPTYANLDVDDTSSFGPEVVTVTRLMQGTYQYWVHNYSGTFNPGITASPARVELNRGGVITAFTPAAGEGSNLWWHVFDLVVDAQCQVRLAPANTWAVALGTIPPATTPVLCPL